MKLAARDISVRNTLLRTVQACVFLVVIAVTISAQAQQVYALSAAQKAIYDKGIPYYDVEVSTACGTLGPSSSLTGSDNEQKIWNYFRPLLQSDKLTAAVVGNIKQESGYNPTIMEIGGNSNDPEKAGSKGWGLVQWTPGSTANTAATNAGITKPYKTIDISNQAGKDEIMLNELKTIWWQMQNVAPTSYPKFIDGFKAYADDLPGATEFFRKNFESGTAGNRQQYAKEVFDKFSNGAVVASGNNCAGGDSLSPDCQSAQGGARLICAAKAYDPASYVWGGGHGDPEVWHKNCPNIDASCGVDCSGLVTMAVYDAFNIKLSQVVSSYPMDKTHWEEIKVSDLQPGDLIVPTSSFSHVEIVDHAVGNTVYTFGAHTSKKPQPQQVGPTTYSRSSLYTAFRWSAK